VADLRERAERAAHWLSHAQWTDRWDAHRAGDDAEQSDEEERR
jgi:5-(carboxyamino)imidazole ribonucleotide synthase